MNRRNRKPPRRRRVHSKKRPRITRAKKGSRKHGRVRRQKISPKITDPRIARGLGLMRRDGLSASEAARRQGMKLHTFRKGAGRFLSRSGPGKPWKARSKEQLRFLMEVLTPKGRESVIVRNSANVSCSMNTNLL